MTAQRKPPLLPQSPALGVPGPLGEGRAPVPVGWEPPKIMQQGIHSGESTAACLPRSFPQRGEEKQLQGQRGRSRRLGPWEGLQIGGRKNSKRCQHSYSRSHRHGQIFKLSQECTCTHTHTHTHTRTCIHTDFSVRKMAGKARVYKRLTSSPVDPGHRR